MSTVYIANYTCILDLNVLPTEAYNYVHVDTLANALNGQFYSKSCITSSHTYHPFVEYLLKPSVQTLLDPIVSVVLKMLQPVVYLFFY